MSVSIIEKPQGYVLGETINVNYFTGVVISNSSGKALFTINSHGLSSGDIIYSLATKNSYSGFLYVDVVSSNTFRVRYTSDGSTIDFIASATSSVKFNILSHKWSSVHLPIVYKLSNDKFPVNTFDPQCGVTSFTNASGLVNLNLDDDLSSFVFDLDYVKIEGAASEEVNGIFQIIDAVATDDVTIDLIYDAGYSFSGATVTYYYNNYHIKIYIYAGLNANHYWADQKPYELVSTLRYTPDSNNEVKFSISEEIKSKIYSISNSLTGDTLPNNIDFMSMFYISFQEIYDVAGEVQEGSIIEGSGIPTFQALSLWTSVGSGFDTPWTTGVAPTITTVLGVFSDNLVGIYDVDNTVAPFTIFPTDTKFVYDFTVSGATSFPFVIRFGFTATDPPIYPQSTPAYFEVTVSSNGHKTGVNFPFASPDLTTTHFKYSYIALSVPGGVSEGGVTVTINDFYITNSSGSRDGRQEFFAVNSKLPFKNVHSGFMSDYIADTLSRTSKFLTLFENPVLFDGYYFDISLIINYDFVSDYGIPSVVHFIREYLDSSGSLAAYYDDNISDIGCGIYRIQPEVICTYSAIRIHLENSSGVVITEKKVLHISCNCNSQGIEGTQITWLNYLGGMEYWVFTGQTEHQIDIKDAKTKVKNLFAEWSKSYGETASTIRQETSRISCFRKTLRSQLISNENLQALQYIKTSSLVQIVNSIYDLRTVLVDIDSFTVYQDNDKEFSISFSIEYTDYIPSQSL